MRNTIFAFILLTSIAYSHASYTAYSGAPGSKGTCASSCHGSGTGTITVTGFPTTYVPGRSYSLSVQYSSGSAIVNFNASARKGTTTTAAGTFAAGTRTAVYTVSGYESGVRASSNNITSATFTWTAPAAGTGNVTFYLSGQQSSKSGPNTKIVLTATEEVASFAGDYNSPATFSLAQNYPNPFNPSTKIAFYLPARSNVKLSVFNAAGMEVRELLNGEKSGGSYEINFSAATLPSGIYFYSLTAIDLESGKAYRFVKKMSLIK